MLNDFIPPTPVSVSQLFKVAFDKGVRTRTVTLDGDAIEPQGTLAGGSAGRQGVTLAKLAELNTGNRELGAREERLRAVSDKLERLSTAAAKVRYKVPSRNDI